jgi:hypothetical protein
MAGWLLLISADAPIKFIKIQIGVIRDCHNDGLTDPPIPTQEWLPRQPPMASRTTQSNRQNQPARRQALK